VVNAVELVIGVAADSFRKKGYKSSKGGRFIRGKAIDFIIGWW
jgi:hypothetical protein